ncbi:hypothetical protein BC829DRAFT_402867, partial [Chytridium lagenaria]
MDANDPDVKIVNATTPEGQDDQGNWSRILFKSENTGETVRTVGIPAGERFLLDREEVGKGGAEIVVVDGEMGYGGEVFGKWSWVRIPPTRSSTDTVVEASLTQGAVLFIKTQHQHQHLPL